MCPRRWDFKRFYHTFLQPLRNASNLLILNLGRPYDLADQYSEEEMTSGGPEAGSDPGSLGMPLLGAQPP